MFQPLNIICYLVNKLAIDTGCKVLFHPKFCIILDGKSGEVKGVRRVKNGLYYYLLNEPVDKTLTCIKQQTFCNEKCSKNFGVFTNLCNSVTSDNKCPSCEQRNIMAP